MEKFEKTDNNFIQNRNDFFSNNQVDAKFAVDNYPLFAGHVPIAAIIGKYEILNQVKSIPGHILEFGVFNGANLLLMAKISKLFSGLDYKKVFGFDTFEGLQHFDNKDGAGKAKKGNYKGDPVLLKKMILLHELEDTVELVVGKIEDTLPKFIEENKHQIYSLIYMDTDLYASTKIALESLWGQLSVGGIIAFDEGYFNKWPGEGIAANEFMKTIKGQYTQHSFSFVRQPMYYLKKIK